MVSIHRSRRVLIGIAVVFIVAFVAPLAVNAGEQILAAAPATASWDETSGYGAVGASRAAMSLPAAPDAIARQTSSDVRWAPVRTLFYVLTPLVAIAMAWDETSGYGALEASRAASTELLAP